MSFIGEIEAKSAIAVKVDKKGIEKIVFEKDIKKQLPIASLTKLMTAVIALENIENYDSFENFLFSMLIESNNEAAESLAKIIGRQEFIDLMNEKAKEMGLEKTKFVNPTGLDPENLSEEKNSSTSEDLVRLAQYILLNRPIIFEISSHQNKVLKESEEYSRLVANKNDLLNPTSALISEDEWWIEEILLNIIGGKTGYTVEAGGCIILVSRDNQSDYFINVILGADSRDTRFTEMKKIVKFFSQ